MSTSGVARPLSCWHEHHSVYCGFSCGRKQHFDRVLWSQKREQKEIDHFCLHVEKAWIVICVRGGKNSDSSFTWNMDNTIMMICWEAQAVCWSPRFVCFCLFVLFVASQSRTTGQPLEYFHLKLWLHYVISPKSQGWKRYSRKKILHLTIVRIITFLIST